MLVLSRRLGEQVVIPYCEMTVTVVAIEGNQVRLGFTAPLEVDVYRREVLERKAQEEKFAGAAGRKLGRDHS